jgi:hypothetical protein
MGANMLLRVIRKKDLPEFVDNLGTRFELYGPAVKEFKYEFRRIGTFSELALGYNTTLLPP